MSKTVIFYIDDETSQQSAKRICRRLSSSKIDCKLLPPPKLESIDAELVSPHPDLYLVDYDLAMQQPDGSIVGYKGSTLATELRSRLPETPIVLITRESIVESLNPQLKKQLFSFFKVYDEVIYKSEVDDMLPSIQEKLLSLSEGFAILRQVKNKSWKSLITLLGADANEAEILKEAIPPLEHDKWTTTEVADWIMNVLLCYPGILYDDVHAATLLGLSRKSFSHPKIQKYFKAAEYKGILHLGQKRWWKHRLLKIAKDFTLSQNANGLINADFRTFFAKKYNVKLEAPKCVWDLQPTADWVCYILHEPVKVNNSLSYNPDNRPSIMDPARVSFRAIRESKEFDDRLVDRESKSLIRTIGEMKDP
jgi:hypothetical protein